MSDEEVEKLYGLLKKNQEAKGYFFNRDLSVTFDLLEGLLEKKKRYGYVSCPCRLACGDPAWDEDIFCPCVYREPDVREYGSCYCQLYVSRDWNEGKVPHVYVPERRPVEKIRF